MIRRGFQRGVAYARGRSIAAFRRLAYERARADLRARSDLWAVLQDYLGRTSSTGCGYTDYWMLYRAVRGLKPTEILECGTGVSTVVLAHALMENEREMETPGRITSMEESERWLDSAVRLLPAQYRRYVDFVHSDTVEDTFSMFRGVRYRNTPDRPYRFVFIDGPTYRSPVDDSPTFDFDFLHVLRRSSGPVSGLVDQRVSTCFALQQILGPRKVRYSPVLHLGLIADCSAADLGKLDQELSSRNFRESFRLTRPTRLAMNPIPDRAP